MSTAVLACLEINPAGFWRVKLVGGQVEPDFSRGDKNLVEKSLRGLGQLDLCSGESV